MMFNLQKFLLIVLFQILIVHSLNMSLKPFEREKTKIEEKINSMRLGNYLRKLMLKVSNLGYSYINLFFSNRIINCLQMITFS